MMVERKTLQNTLSWCHCRHCPGTPNLDLDHDCDFDLERQQLGIISDICTPGARRETTSARLQKALCLNLGLPTLTPGDLGPRT